MGQNTVKAGAAQRKGERREEGRKEKEREGESWREDGREKQREISVYHQEKSPQCGGKGTLLYCWWECKTVQPLWKTGAFPMSRLWHQVTKILELQYRSFQ